MNGFTAARTSSVGYGVVTAAVYQRWFSDDRSNNLFCYIPASVEGMDVCRRVSEENDELLTSTRTETIHLSETAACISQSCQLCELMKFRSGLRFVASLKGFSGP